MRDLVEDDASHLTAKQLRVVSVEPHERAAVGPAAPRRSNCCVGLAACPMEAEQPLTEWRFVFDHDLHIRHACTQLRRQRVERILRVPLEPFCRIERIAVHLASEPCAAANAEPRLHSSVRLPILPRCPDEQGDDDHRRHEHQDNENDRSRNVHADIRLTRALGSVGLSSFFSDAGHEVATSVLPHACRAQKF